MKFIRGVIDEMKKVTWPTGKQLRKDTLVVIETSVMFAVFFFVVDYLIKSGLALILN